MNLEKLEKSEMWEKNIIHLGYNATVPEVTRHPGPPLRRQAMQNPLDLPHLSPESP